MPKADCKVEHNNDGVSLSAPVIVELIQAVMEKGVPFRFKAGGISMTPAIRDGDVITISPIAVSVPKRGDVLAFSHPERPQMLVHRVLHKKEKCYFIKGDNSSQADGWVPAENVLGLITQVERLGKARFWPNRSRPHFRSTAYLSFYLAWLPIRRIMARILRRLLKAIHLGKYK